MTIDQRLFVDTFHKTCETVNKLRFGSIMWLVNLAHDGLQQVVRYSTRFSDNYLFKKIKQLLSLMLHCGLHGAQVLCQGLHYHRQVLTDQRRKVTVTD